MLDAVKTIQPVDVPSQELKALKLKVLVSALLFSPAVSKASRPSFTGPQGARVFHTHATKATLVECLECKLQLHDNQVELLKAQWHFI